jgi:hypothetical protein
MVLFLISCPQASNLGFHPVTFTVVKVANVTQVAGCSVAIKVCKWVIEIEFSCNNEIWAKEISLQGLEHQNPHSLC